MSWETRARGGRYYTRSKKVGGRVVRQYVGTGPVAEAWAALDAQARADRQASAGARRTERARLEAADGSLAELCATAGALARAALLLAGYRQHHRGEWRRKRGQD
jgi:hypothetical protein